ncbi:MAG: MMPL family transporter [Candidatus Woesearchaeota archaeon]
MNKLKKLFTNIRIIILIICIILAIIAIYPNPNVKGLAIRGVTKDSAAADAGIIPPPATVTPTGRERVLSINNIPINSLVDYSNAVKDLKTNMTIIVKTNKNTYFLQTKPNIQIIQLNETETQEITDYYFNETLNKTVNYTRTIIVNKTKEENLGTQDLGLKLYQAPTSNIRLGLDLIGGTRVLLKPETNTSQQDINTIIDNMKERLNIYGLSDIVIKQTNDLAGNPFILIEVAGVNEEEIKELISKQGKFEAKINNQSVFRGGQDIKYVCRSAECSGLDSRRGCQKSGDQWFCRFMFSISLSSEAAKRQAEITNDLKVTYEGGEGWLDAPLDLYLDDELVDTLRISNDLKGKEVTEISISGSGSGSSQQEAASDALKNMKRLQTILITGSLPTKLDIVKTDNISPVLGKEFINNVYMIILIALVCVSLVIFVRYRKILIVIPVVVTLISEVIILLGTAALINWNLDLIAIAGIIIAIGVGVDAQVVIADETIKKEKEAYSNWKEKVKNAFFIIMASYLTMVVAMIPLMSAGAGLLKGFAITTIIGVSIGTFITRPAFAAIAEVLFKE